MLASFTTNHIKFISIMIINCPKCHKETEFLIGDAIDELGEVFKCQHCGWPFRYVKENEVR